MQKCVRFILDFGLQVNTDALIMQKLQRKHNNSTEILSPMFIAYGKCSPLMYGDVVVSELLGSNLTCLKHKNVSEIKRGTILALNALRFMHIPDKNGQNSVIHLDVKHENFSFGLGESTEIVKVIDFGISEIVSRSSSIIPTVQTRVSGTPMYMSTMKQSGRYIIDYMDDLQALAWMLLDLLGGRPIRAMPWSGGMTHEERLASKEYFLAHCVDPEYTDAITNGTLTPHNIHVIAELAEYTRSQADKCTQCVYDTDMKFNGCYYSYYNPRYYKDIRMIIEKIE